MGIGEGEVISVVVVGFSAFLNRWANRSMKSWGKNKVDRKHKTNNKRVLSREGKVENRSSG